LKLLIDENLSPLLARWANDQGVEASAVVHVALQGRPDIQVWQHAYAQSQIVVTVNVGDFISLAQKIDLHPGVIALREAGLSRSMQWERLQEAIRYVETHCAGDLTNQVLEVKGVGDVLLHNVPQR
jgi:predicted nuclease of predicted toxin-antitoxin system